MYSIVLLAGGKGSRMKNSIPKQYMLLAGKPVIMHTLERIDTIDEICEAVIVCSSDYTEQIKFMVSQYGIKKPIKYAEAGASRQASVLSGLELVASENVIIHEAARPFVKKSEFLELINNENDNVIIGSPISFTVLKGNGRVEGIFNRSELINVQLPQKFNTALLVEAHRKARLEGRTFTEDASVLFYYNRDIAVDIMSGTDYNIKITTPTDMLVGKIIYDEYFSGRAD